MCGSKKTKGPKQDDHNQQRPHMSKAYFEISEV